MMPQTNILTPDSDAPLIQKYDRAWLLLTNPGSFPDDRAHAKCWLSYRVLEGGVSLADWTAKIATVATGDNSLRWNMSQGTVNAFIQMLVAGDVAASIDLMRGVVDTVESSGVLEHPGVMLNYLRCAAIIAYHHLINDAPIKASKCLDSAQKLWRESWASNNLTSSPFRYIEARGDCSVLHVMQCMRQRLGEIDPEIRLRAPWAEDILAAGKDAPWWRCIEKLSREKTIW